MRNEKIKNIKKRFKNEWLLIRVVKSKNADPLEGQLIEHNPDRTFIYKKIAKYNSRFPIFITYSQDTLPKGYIAAFFLHA